MRASPVWQGRRIVGPPTHGSVGQGTYRVRLFSRRGLGWLIRSSYCRFSALCARILPRRRRRTKASCFGRTRGAACQTESRGNPSGWPRDRLDVSMRNGRARRGSPDHRARRGSPTPPLRPTEGLASPAISRPRRSALPFGALTQPRSPGTSRISRASSNCYNPLEASPFPMELPHARPDRLPGHHLR